MSDIDRRIAIEIFGEEEPKAGTWHENDDGIKACSFVVSESWSPCEIWDKYADFVGYRWEPDPFSSVLEEALRALDKYLIDKGFDESAGFTSNYHRGMEPKWMAAREGVGMLGQTLPEAICNLLLALKEKA